MSHSILPALAIVCLTLSGCGHQQAPPRVGIEGSVTLDGKPLDGVMIRFVPKQAGHGAATMLVDGRFELGEAEGPTVGEHDVVFNPVAPELPQAIEAMRAGTRDPLNARAVPVRYQTAGGVQTAVSQTDNHSIEFKLTSRTTL